MQRKAQVVTLAHGTCLKTAGGEEIVIDPHLLFQRWATAGLNAGDLGELLTSSHGRKATLMNITVI